MSEKQLGPYTLGERIGKGGMGSVYEAIDQTTGDRVAVKSLSPQLAAAEGFRERFEAEIESLKILQHEGIVRLLGFGEDDGVLFYSMELVDGPSLEDEIARHRRFSWQETLGLGVQICRALKHAHDHGVVHRDIKPANLLLTPEGRVKIADFGIARLFGATQLTTAGGVLGTADYMSPEQADGRPVTDKCDQYSLGSVMYALLAGRPPFRASTMPEMLQLQRFAEAEPVRRYAPETPEQLDRLIQQLLSKDPDHRFPNVLVLARHMEAMQKALARRQQAAGDGTTGGGSSAALVGNAPGGTSAAQPDETLLFGDAAAHSSSIDLEVAKDVYDAPTMAAEDQTTPRIDAPPPEDVTPPPTSGRRFTTVAEEAQRASRPDESERLFHWLQLAALVLALLAMVAIGWTLMRPPTADELYEQIELASAEGQLHTLEWRLDAFEASFPDDPRQETVPAFREEIELTRLERQIRGKSRLAGSQSTHPAESLYTAARQLAPYHPHEAASMLRNMLALYGGAAAESDDDSIAPWLALAERELAKLDAAAQARGTAAAPILNARLEHAAQLENEDPQTARAIYQAAIELYGQQPWAEPLVARAKERLAALGGDDGASE